jgi:hypothetical protein
MGVRVSKGSSSPPPSSIPQADDYTRLTARGCKIGHDPGEMQARTFRRWCVFCFNPAGSVKLCDGPLRKIGAQSSRIRGVYDSEIAAVAAAKRFTEIDGDRLFYDIYMCDVGM